MFAHSNASARRIMFSGSFVFSLIVEGNKKVDKKTYRVHREKGKLGNRTSVSDEVFCIHLFYSIL